MSTEANTTAAEQKAEKKTRLVDLFVPRAQGNEDPNLIISINGKTWLLPKGKTSQVPPMVKAEYDRAMRAAESYEQTRERLLGASE